MAFGKLSYIAVLWIVPANTSLGDDVIERRIAFDAMGLKPARLHAERLARIEGAKLRGFWLAYDMPPWAGSGDPVKPDPDCYGCLGTGAIKGFGHDGKRCLCLDMEDAA